MRCAIWGAGFIGAVHAASVKKIEGYDLTAIVDMNEQVGRKLAEDYNCLYYADAEKMLKTQDVDVVHICLPTYLHERYVLLAAKYNKHILCEKPFSLSVESAQRMKDACEKANVQLMVAQAARWWPEFIKIKKMLAQGEFGEVHMLYSNRLAQHPNWSTWHRDPKKSGGSLYDLNLHNIDFLIDLFGDVDSVYAVGWKSPTGCWNHVISSLTFKNGVKAVDEGSFEIIGDFPFSISLRLTGDKATVDYKFTAGFNIENLNAASSETILFAKGEKPKALVITGMDAYEAEIRDFVGSLRDQKPAAIPPAVSVKVIEVVAAIERSLETGKLVRL